ncbi:MAG TPA: DUF4419 domain-containing protein [Polyangiaceae bacterium]|nr:DUF4419 domain-containing protein [Polyangiaceae bacterium]
MTTFSLSAVSRGPLYPPLDVEASVRNLLKKPVEAMGCGTQRLVSCDTTHAFVKAAYDAFYRHYPLTIRPDDVWLCIAQGFAAHVNHNAEELRSRFVAHSGKKKLVVERPDFFLGQANPWPEAFCAFSEQIGAHVGKLRELVCARFSTTTPIEEAAFDVCLMDTFQGYFEYEMLAGCGIPEITVLGTPEDWRSMIPRVKHLSEYGLNTWCDSLVPVLEKIADTAAGKVDREFWLSFFRYQSGSGPAELTGWILTLFPYLVTDWQTKALGPNPYLSTWKARFDHAMNRTGYIRFDDVQGPSIALFPEGLVSAPVHYVDRSRDRDYDLRFVAGMFGVEQDVETRALSASFGWAVVYDDAK